VPRTRTEVEREAKVGQIVERAVRRLREGGYDALSVAGIARELGIAQNAVYWYFPSKDHLFVAALEHMLREIHARKPPPDRALEKKVLFFVEQLAGMSEVRAALQERAKKAEVAAEFAANLDALWRRMLTNVLRGKVADEDLEATVTTLLATFQGALLGDHTPAERKRIVAFALKRLVG
jgi:AcrR family transcriptional regulator